MLFQIKATKNYKPAGWLYIDNNKGYLITNKSGAWKTQNREAAYYLLNLCKVKEPTYKWELATY